MAKTHDIEVSMLEKKVFLNTKKTRWCIVQLYNYRFDMERDYEKYCKVRGQKADPILGASCGYHTILITGNNKEKLSGETGTVYLSMEDCGAGVVTHELMHAVLWAWKHRKSKEPYPIVINNIEEEEELLHNHTFAVTQFYTWFWKVAKEVKNTK